MFTYKRSQIFTDVLRCSLDFLKMFSGKFQDVLGIFSGCSHDIKDTLMSPAAWWALKICWVLWAWWAYLAGGSGGSIRFGGSGGFVGSIGFVWSGESAWLCESGWSGLELIFVANITTTGRGIFFPVGIRGCS